MKFHDAANIFPMDDENIDALAEDIKQHNQLCPIEIYEGKILDGRRRWMACRFAGVEPEFVDVSPDDPISYVLSLNLHRRHLSATQMSMVAARARDIYDRDAEKRMLAGKKQENPPVNLPEGRSDARDAAGEAVGVSGKSVDYGTKVLKHGSKKLIEACDQDKIAVSTAAKLTAKSKTEQDKLLKSMKGKPGGRKLRIETETPAPPAGESRGIGVQRAHEAIACLKKIPLKDGLRKRGLQIVSDWIHHNK